jgi:tyrosyl-tRNA synthetase
MDRYYTLLLGEQRDAALHPMEAKKQLGAKITARYHSEEDAKAARDDWETRFSKRDLASAELPELSTADLPADTTVLTLVSHVFETSFGLKKSNGDLRKQFISAGAVQLDGEKITDPSAGIAPTAGQILRLSKKHSVRFI